MLKEMHDWRFRGGQSTVAYLSSITFIDQSTPVYSLNISINGQELMSFWSFSLKQRARTLKDIASLALQTIRHITQVEMVFMELSKAFTFGQVQTTD